jgi:hypothetical protein
MADPMQPVNDAKEEVARRQARRQDATREIRPIVAVENIADDLTLLRAEMSVMRGLLAMIAAKR